MIFTGIEGLRDPFLVEENGVYYMYGTGIFNGNWDDTVWACYVNDSGRLDSGEWKLTDHPIYELPKNAAKNRWAPEVHKYEGNFYMFTTYFSTETGRRGCTILKSPSPTGPFVEITNGHITSDKIDAIDGTLYVDKKGQPWMIYVHEWVCKPDKVGTMEAAKLSDDLRHFISEPIELFRADAPSWATKGVTDGCFMYETKDGQLLMLWSNFDKDGYCVGIARSDDGTVEGKWTQDETLLFSKALMGEHDGGHGMVFTDKDGTTYLCLHSPNIPTKELKERTLLIPLREENGTLICEL